MFFAGEALQPMFLVPHPAGSVYSAFESHDRSILLSIDYKVFKVHAESRSVKQIFDSGEPLLPIISIHAISGDKIMLVRNRSLLVWDLKTQEMKDYVVELYCTS